MSQNMITLPAQVSLTAAAKDKPARVSIVAYTGAAMRLAGFRGEVVVESASLKLGAVTLMSDHQYDRQNVVGSGHAAVLPDGSITVTGTISRATEAGRQIVALSADGVQWQASLGVYPSRIELVKPGDRVTVNGKTFKAGAIGIEVIRAGELKEVSIVALGADGSTSVSISAKFHGDDSMSQETETTIQDEQQHLTATQSESRLTASQAAHQLVLAKIAKRYREERPYQLEAIDDFESQAIQAGWDANRFELELIRGLRPKASPSNIIRNTGGTTPETLEASLMLRAGNEAAAVKTYGANIVQRAHDLRCRSLMQLAAMCLMMSGKSVSGESDDSMLRAAFSTTSLPTILSNVMGKTLAVVYEEAMQNLRLIAKIVSARDFKDQKILQPAALQSMEVVGAAGELKHTSIGEESTYTWSLATYGKMLSVTRTEMVNDDLGYFDTLPQALAQSAFRTLNDLVWRTWLAGIAANHWHSNNANLLTSSSALAIGTLGTAVKTMRIQRDSAGNDLNIAPETLIVPPTLESTGRALLNSTDVVGPTDEMTPSGNPVKGLIKNLVVAPQLENTDKFSGASTAGWFLSAGPAAMPVLIGFLNGRQSPVVETEDAPFNTLGVQMRVYHDFACKLGDPNASVHATGAA